MFSKYLSFNLVENWRYQPSWGVRNDFKKHNLRKVSPTIQSYYYDHKLIYDQDLS